MNWLISHAGYVLGFIILIAFLIVFMVGAFLTSSRADQDEDDAYTEHLRDLEGRR